MHYFFCVAYKDTDPTWLLQDATFEKMGALMAENGGRQLGMFDELSAFLIKIKLYSSRGLTDSHELAMFLELHNANPWTRTTGISYIHVRPHINVGTKYIQDNILLLMIWCSRQHALYNVRSSCTFNDKHLCRVG